MTFGAGGGIFTCVMEIDFTYWKEASGWYLGYLNEYPDHWTQGETLDDLKEHLLDLYKDFSADVVEGIRRVGKLQYA